MEDFSTKLPQLASDVNGSSVGSDDKDPPTAKNPATFNTYSDTFGVLGRSVRVSMTIRN